MDEFFVHQIPAPIEHVGSPEVQWTDWLATLVCPPSGREGPLLIACMGSFPNSQTMQSHALVSDGVTQHNLRCTRELRNDRSQMTVGPMAFDVVQPLRRWRGTLAANDVGPVTYDLEYRADVRPHLARVVGPADAGVTEQVWMHGAQPVRVHGEIRVDGRTYEVDGWPGAKTRSWGVRTVDMGMRLWLWFTAHFEGRSLYLVLQEGDEGTPASLIGCLFEGDAHRIIVDVEHECSFAPADRSLLEATLRLKDDTGRWWTLNAKRRCRGVGYNRASFRGEGWWDAKDVPEVDGESWNVGDDARWAQVGVGLKQEPFSFHLDGQPGDGLGETALSRKHGRYGRLAA